MPEKGLATRTDINNVHYLARSLKIPCREIQIEGGKKILLKIVTKTKISERKLFS